MTFQFNWKVSLFCAVFLVTFINLGFWQLRRETEKTTLLEERDRLLMSAPRSADDIQSMSRWQGVPIRLTGQFDETVVLLQDNRVLEGRVGFEIVQRFKTQAGDFLVNRGFMPMGRTRDDLPEIPPVPGRVSITGVMHEPGDAVILKDVDLEVAFPLVVQEVDFDWLAQADIKVFRGIVRLNEDQPGALPRYWPDVVMQPAQHRGYAVQWFAMAFAITLAWLFFSIRREKEHE